ncbi:hypothetical protein CVIRNUC_006504 [Coccomyxa viridis]|uniref:Uncharacterized protein n=1 Tax=Coccomyxa viridis TaxID=1274662 RepID=A0AAV1IBA7_9CHLO|nr:hypothetical protein CVIRNUC_006504 [Coccomyxa viridis]
MVNSPLIVRLPPSVVWPLVLLMANRALEMLCLLLGFVTPLFSVLQLPLSLTALGLYIRDTQCGPFARRSQASPPQPFCTAPIVLAAVIVLVEVVVFLMVLFITQTFRHERIMELAQQAPAKQYIVVKQPCGQEYMVAKALQGPPALQSSACEPTSFPLGMHCNSIEPLALTQQRALSPSSRLQGHRRQLHRSQYQPKQAPLA